MDQTKPRDRKWALFGIAVVIGGFGLLAIGMGGQSSSSSQYMQLDQQNAILDQLNDPSARWIVEYRDSDGYIMSMGVWHPGEPEITSMDGTSVIDMTSDPNLRSLVEATLSPDPLPWKIDLQTLQLAPSSTA